MNPSPTIRLHVVIALLVLAVSFTPAAILWENPSHIVSKAPVETLLDACSRSHSLEALATGGKKFGTQRAQVESDLPGLSTAVPPKSCLSACVKEDGLPSGFLTVILAGGNRAPPAPQA